MNRRLLAAAALPIACVLTLSACGGSSDSASGGGKQSECNQAGGAPTAVNPVPSGPTAGGVTVISSGDAPPSVIVADNATSATSLISLDITEGDGAAVKVGDTITVEYCGVSVPEGTVFDSSWVSGQPATFSLDGVIAGWLEGVPTMKVGGTRLLVIPGDKAYGANPPDGSGIAPNATLAFVITLTDIAPAQ